MPVVTGHAESGLDRALAEALQAGIDDTLETGELYPGERTIFPDDRAPYDRKARPWQLPLGDERQPPSSDEPLVELLRRAVGRSRPPELPATGPAAPLSGAEPPAAAGVLAARGPAERVPTAPEATARRARSTVRRLLPFLFLDEPGAKGAARVAAEAQPGAAGPKEPGASDGPATPTVDLDAALARQGRALPAPVWRGLDAEQIEPTNRKFTLSSVHEFLRKHGAETGSRAVEYRMDFDFRDELTGVVMIHGIGPHLAGQTLLEWTRPIATAITDAIAADAAAPEAERRLESPGADAVIVDDPIYKANIDFSGETFPVIQLRVPRRRGTTARQPGREERWIVTEAWWASEIRPPSLRTMMGWMGEEGGIGRILQGIQENTLGKGVLARVARLSLQALVSVVVSFVLLVFAVLLGLVRLIPFGPFKDFVALKLASSFVTDWFGGARTLLRDPPQTANVRGRLVATIKALRAYGCRDIVLVAHSGGTMVALQTLTDPAYPRLQVEKLVTIGEALNLGWRLENLQQEADPPELAPGNRMAGRLAADQPRLLWRDFYATHDPAPCGRPDPPLVMQIPQRCERFLAERVYNVMSVTGDHGAYWDNDEHFVVPLIREIDMATSDRSGSRFYSDAAESKLRSWRKERVSLLVLWRRATLALPAMAILAAALVTSGGMVVDAGRAVVTGFRTVPFAKEMSDAGRSLHDQGTSNALSLAGLSVTWAGWYQVGLFVLQAAFLLLLLYAILPARADRLWYRRPAQRLFVFALDLALGLLPLAAIAVAWVVSNRSDLAGAASGLAPDSGLPGLAVAFVGLVLFGYGGRSARARIASLGRDEERRLSVGWRFGRDALIVGSAFVLAITVLVLLLLIVGVALVLAGNSSLTDGGDANRLFVLGSLAAIGGFQVLQRLGTWRWQSWDERERRALRRHVLRQSPADAPHRLWAYFLAILLSVLAILAALAVANRGWPLGDASLMYLAGLALVIVAISQAKDVVDNDVDTPKAAASIVPPHPGAAAGGEAA